MISSVVVISSAAREPAAGGSLGCSSLWEASATACAACGDGCAVRMAFVDRNRRVVVVRRRRILAGKTIASAEQRNGARDDGADQRQRDDGFVHAA